MKAAPPTGRSYRLRGPLLCAFFVSGLSGLLFEVVWTRLLVTVFGATSLAVASVLAAYMAGLGLGSLLGGRLADRLRRPLLAYALLEGGVALFGLAVPAGVAALTPLYRALYQAYSPHFLTFSLLRFSLLFFLLLVPTTLMGATLPILSRFAAPDARGAAPVVARLYAVNTAGAVLGTLLAGLVLLPQVGLRATSGIACAVGLTLCLAVMCLAWRHERALPPAALATVTTDAPVPPGVAEAKAASSPADRSSISPAETRVATPPSDPPHAVAWTPSRSALDAERTSAPAVRPSAIELTVLLGLAVTGAASMIDEVAWTRALVQLVGPSTYAFSLMLAVFLAGLALGSGGAGWLLQRLGRPRLFFGLTQGLIGGASIVALLSFEPVQLLYRLVTGAAPGGRGPLALGMKALCAALLLLPTTLLIGAAFPLATAALVRTRERVGSRVGLVYAANTFGCILGSLLAGFLLVPSLGIERALQLAAALNIGVGVVMFGLGEALTPRLRAAGLLALLFFGLTVALRPLSWDGLLLTLGEHSADQALVFSRPGYNATVAVTLSKHRRPMLTLSTDGKPDGSDVGDLHTQVQLGLVPMLFHDHPQKVLVVGLATGITAGAALADPRVRQLDVLEIERAMVDASHFFDAVNGRPLADPRTRLIEIDARNYYRAAAARYDVIISEPSNPWMSGPSHLFTREAFAEARALLRPGGVMLQWVQGYSLRPKTAATLFGAFREQFPHVLVLRVQNQHDFLLLGSERPLPLDLEALSRRLGPLEPALRRGGLEDAWDLVAEVVGDQASLARLTAGVPPNSDDNGAVEFGAPWDVGAQGDLVSWLVRAYPGPYATLLDQGASPQQIGGRLGFRMGENFAPAMAEPLERFLRAHGQAPLASEVAALVHLRSNASREENPDAWVELLRRQRAWLFGEKPRQGPLELGLSPNTLEVQWLAAVRGEVPAPLDDVVFDRPLGPMEARALADQGECEPVKAALPWFWQLLLPGVGPNLGLARAAAMGAEMAGALRRCQEPALAATVDGAAQRWRSELATLLAKASPERAHDALVFDGDSEEAWRQLAIASCQAKDRAGERTALLKLVALRPWDARFVARLSAISGDAPDAAVRAAIERARPYAVGRREKLNGAGCLLP